MDIDRVSPTVRPQQSVAGYQCWHRLLFLHWSMTADDVRPFVPESLDIDTFEGRAYVGLVLFEMSGVRPRWFPAVPGLSAFPETNVRTYVHHRGHGPGVWFFSLDAANTIAVRVARWKWRLPYFRSEMRVAERNQRVAYSSRRLWPDPAGAFADVEAEIGAINPVPSSERVGSSKEDFLLERYLLYVESDNGLLRGQVHHPRYPTNSSRLVRFDESLVQASGIPRSGRPEHVIYSPGVEVEVFPLTAVI